MDWLSLFGARSRHERAVDAHRPTVAAIHALSEEFSRLSDQEIKERILRFKGVDREEIKRHLPEIYAGVREAAKRTVSLRHFDVQLLGGLALFDGGIAEMKTGEGKTLVATLPLIAHALIGKGAHLVTVNDYLATRDAAWMQPIYAFFDLTVGVVLPGQTPAEKRAAYACDITYGTNNEFGFDYLRDNMAGSVAELTQRELYFAIVDEVDSILIDEARTPLIISAPDSESTHLYGQFARLIPQLKENEHYNIDEKRRAATLTDEGVSAVETMLKISNIYEEKGIRFVHHLEQALRAHTLYHRDKDYVVQEGQVIIVDEFTGRLMPGRRYSEGLHQAIEAKEKVPVQQESRTLATITFQNFFRLYKYLGGMTGTAVTSAEEFEKVYNLDVVVIPTNRPLTRRDKTDRIFMDEEAKFRAVARELAERNKKGQPVLVGTIAIEKSEYLSALLTKEGVPHQVLNAKQHAREAEIVAQAGQKGAVTISTNMAGRGTDIKLGEGVANIGGLFVLGTERHEARRIDNQLRGRSGRQGDPGETQFFVSLEDDVMRIFGGDRVKGLMKRLNVSEDEPIENRLVSKALEGAQERVEGYYFDMRKQVLSYDDVLNRQRNAIYTLRRGILEKNAWRELGKEEIPLADHMKAMLFTQAASLVEAHTASENPEDWDTEEIAETIHSLCNVPVSAVHEQLKSLMEDARRQDPTEVREHIKEEVGDLLWQQLALRRQTLGPETFTGLEQMSSLRAIDTHWMDHLDTMDYLRTGIGLRSYGQRDPLVEYQREAHGLFQQLLGTITASLTEMLFKAQVVQPEATPQGQAFHDSGASLHQLAGSTTGGSSAPTPAPAQPTGGHGQLHNPYKKVGRNDPCPCGSGKKFKKCHGA